MSYRCEVCSAVAPPKAKRHLHVVPRRGADGQAVHPPQIARELPVCASCAERLRTVSLSQLMAEHASRPPVSFAAPAVILKSRPAPAVAPLEMPTPAALTGRPTTSSGRATPALGGLGSPVTAQASAKTAPTPPRPPKAERRPAPAPMQLRKPPQAVPTCERCGSPADMAESPLGSCLCEGCLKSSAATAASRGTSQK